jgi:3-oxoacyl-[acyl-carrier protein] reductase
MQEGGMMNIDLGGRRAVITGGSRGIGKAIAVAMAGAGAEVSICARGAEGLAAARAEIARAGGNRKVHSLPCDIADAAAVAGYVAAAAAALGGIDILVCNASGYGSSDDEAGWEKSLSVDLLGCVRAIRAALPHLEQSGAGSIVNISSISGLRATARTPPYAAIKAAMINYTMTAAAQFAPKRIRVNCVAPGSIEFPGGTWARVKDNNPQLYGRILRSIPFDRLGLPEEVANVVVFLSSPLAQWVTGQTIAVDGGQML